MNNWKTIKKTLIYALENKTPKDSIVTKAICVVYIFVMLYRSYVKIDSYEIQLL